jgi:hypothetical protein
MKRRCLAFLCGLLVVWAAVDDALAAATPEPDDDIAAAADNDSLQSPVVHVQVQVELQDLMSACLPHVVTAITGGTADVTTALPPNPAYRLADSLYLLMSLQR